MWQTPTCLWATINQGIPLVTKNVWPNPLSMFNCKLVSFSRSIIQIIYLQDSNIIHWIKNTNKISLEPFVMINDCLHQDIVSFRLEWVEDNYKIIFTLWFFCNWICVALMVPWTEGKPQRSLNPIMTLIRSSPTCHLGWIFNTTFTTHTNSCSTKCTIDFPMAKSLEQWRFWNAWANLYKSHATQYSQALQIEILCSSTSLVLASSSIVAHIVCSHESAQSNNDHHIVLSKNVTTRWLI